MNEEIKKKLITIAKNKGYISEEDGIVIHGDTLFETFLNSITYIQFLIACEEEFDIEIDDDDLEMEKMRCINDVAVYISHLL